MCDNSQNFANDGHHSSESGRDRSAANEPYSYLRHLVNAIYGPHDPNMVQVVALTAYFDGSFTDKPNDPPWIMTVGGFLSSEKRWLWFEDRWSKLLAKYGLKYFQMKEFTTFKGQFGGWREREQDRREFIRKAADIIARTASQSFAASLLIEDWNMANEGYTLDDNGYYPYPICGLACIQHVRVWCRNRPHPYPIDQVMYVFEKGDPKQADLRRLADKEFGVEIQTPKAIPDDPTQRPLGALQAADFASWHARNIALKKESGELDKYREDFKLLFSRVPTYPHHAHFSMKVYPHRSADDPPELASIRNEEDDSDEASLVRFCQRRRIPLRPGMSLWKRRDDAVEKQS